MDDIYIKEEITINDVGVSEYVLDADFDFETIKAEPTTFIPHEDEHSIIEKKPFTLCFINDSSNILETYDVAGSSTAIKKIENSSLPRKHSLERKYQRLISKKQRIQNKQTKINPPKKKKSIVRRQSLPENLERTYLCELCQSEFKGKKLFISHLNQHFTVKNSLYICNICFYQSSFKAHINRHIYRSHCFQNSELLYEQKRFACSLCDKRFFESKDLVRHKFVHTRCGPLKCNVCSFSHITKAVFERHIQLHNTDEIIHEPRQSTSVDKQSARYECHHCGTIRYSKDLIRAHIERHLCKYRFVCNDCGYKCFDKGALKKHFSSMHSDERPFVCNQCLKTFKRKSHLLSHIKRKHSCNKSSSNKQTKNTK